ncbi:uncharacterized protein FA14DRAFT_159119 [Meira miltonrushii]|uniref:BZIP domain-containing protein n=1 Tax=Meira miltonrushii TaxID=1280837 RepID=A0A316VGF3_9BASI|nr:uncharacterized protein FA14DRAFT_159119 [Meira miltonrushii]PWN36717.1 hypothetical protein FA14DRAFT_159119 [Meira miltonrushii]
MAPKRQKSALARTPNNQDVNMSEGTARKNEKSLSTSKVNRNTHDRSSPSGEDDDFEEDEEEDDDEDEEDEDEDDDDEEEEDEGVDDNGGFDEKFLAQLMAMDPIFSNKNGQPAVSSQMTFETPSNGTASSTNKDDPVSTRPLPASHGTPFPNMPAYASAASTPSNEFYDGAINFLTEVLGSSDPSMWNSAESQQNQTGWPAEQQFTTVQTAASPAPTQAQFKNLQPLIGNLIARLKGQPVDESEQGARVLENDLVVLLQSLMAQRQAQEERKSTQKSDKGQKDATPRAEVQRKPAQTPQQPTISQPNAAFPTMDEINALAASFPIMADANANATQQPQAGFSIVDFDFGDDDDDPDFVPSNLNLAQPFDESSQALAQALASTNGQNGNTDAWQQMMSSFGNPGSTPAGTGMAAGMPMSPAGGGEARRTRSVSKNTDNQTLSSAALKQLDNSIPPNTLTEDSREDGTSSTHESEEENPKGKKRRVYTTEEALERRREANRECARRQRAKKKEETEAIRKELERIQSLGIGGAKVGSENIIDVTQALVGRRKRGRPLGSRNRRTMEDMKRYSEEVEQENEMADLRADNRMLRAEMHRLQEENAKLRANALRHEEVMQMMGEHDLIKNKERRNGKRISYGGRSSHQGGSPIHDGLDEGDDLPNNLSNTQDPAGDFLAYNPFRSFQRAGNSHSVRETVELPPPSSLRRQEQNIDSGFHNPRTGPRGVPAHRAIHHQQQSSRVVGNPRDSLQDLLQAAATEMGGYDYT